MAEARSRGKDQQNFFCMILRNRTLYYVERGFSYCNNLASGQRMRLCTLRQIDSCLEDSCSTSSCSARSVSIYYVIDDEPLLSPFLDDVVDI
jgi:hypothetical protein